MVKSILFFMPAILAATTAVATTQYAIVDTDQNRCFSEQGKEISCYGAGQDGSYSGNSPSYIDNCDGTVTDNVTGLMWQKNPGAKMTYAEAVAGEDSFHLAGYTDWRLPSIKELYSLIQFNGNDLKPNGFARSKSVPFIDTAYFDFAYGDVSIGERIIDSQYVSNTRYVSTTMDRAESVFGVNFADGRIKGYGVTKKHGREKTFYVMHVRGNTDYGVNDFVDNGDGTITDTASGLMWMKDDSGNFNVGDYLDGSVDWEQALTWAENLTYAGYSDWRLPDAKELQSIVDYSRSPKTTGTAAIDPVFHVTPIIAEGGGVNFPFYWTGTTHKRELGRNNSAIYIAFGEALGFMIFPRSGGSTLMDVHGAGAQRSDPKVGDPADYPYGLGPQGDVVRIYNYARCVRTLQ